MKAYTDLEQSKKLAEFLPLESADMYYAGHQSIINPKEWEYGDTPKIRGKYISFDDKRIFYPCWSLAALINIIPQEIFDGEYIINITEGCDNRWVLTYDHFENRNHSYYGLSTGADNLVDACVAMIEKLHKLNLL